MKGFRNRILVPLAVPVGATVVLVAVVFNFSRILLILEERRSATVATVLAIAAASAVLGGFTYFAARTEALRTGVSVLACAGVILIFAGGYSLGATGEEGGEGHEETEAPVALGGNVDIAGKEFTFEPKETSVPAGPITFNLTNAGKVLHTLALEGVPQLAKLAAPKGGTATGKVDLTPGTYVYFCDEAGHRGAGMQGTLTVTEGGGGAGGGAPLAGGSSTEIGGKEFAFDPKDVTVASGPVKISLRNDGKVLHTIAFEGIAGFAKLAAPKGETVAGTLDAGPGTYVFYCDEAGHRGAGMEGKLTVTGGSAGGAKPSGEAKKPGGGASTDVVGKEFLFEPKEVSVPAGPVTINLKNEGKVVHTLAFDGIPEFATLKAEKGGTATGTLNIGPGTYTFFCNEAGHRGAGMEGTLKVG
ncbi:MAG TPA: cupredoxin domain-containing protein [Acidimicrobiia bacterium]|nr:cupredoxin domain-containing protein [Acidimicrobiia bacterium]